MRKVNSKQLKQVKILTVNRPTQRVVREQWNTAAESAGGSLTQQGEVKPG